MTNLNIIKNIICYKLKSENPVFEKGFIGMHSLHEIRYQFLSQLDEEVRGFVPKLQVIAEESEKHLSDNFDLNPRPTRWGYAVFGTIIQGMEVVDSIGHAPTTAKGTFESNVPVDSIVIETIELLED